ncbi:MAG: molybdopterin molybdotransferase MoeA, partial [Anaerolineales bacterium]|nr:molybdopterin molybdotransferase MoeA [Anaerolineales bacterium]
MLTVAEARARILEHFQPLGTEVVALEAARGRVLAETIYAAENLPPFPNASMDGYAVHLADTAHATPDSPVTLPVSGDIPAGAPLPGALPPGTAMRIMTGAPVPGGADAIVPVEETDDGRNHAHHSERTALPAQIRIFKAPRPGANIRPVGQDVSVGQQVLTPGVRLRPAALGVLAALGHTQVRVYCRPRVALLSTGDELVSMTDTPRPGQIRDINSITLAAAIEQYGGEPLRLGVAPDRLDEVRRRLQQAVAEGVNLILSSAGVSVGAYDVVKGALEADGELTFWKVNMRP